MVEGLLEKPIIISNEPVELTSMYEIKRSFKQPFLLVVVDFKCTIWRKPSRLSSERLLEDDCNITIGVGWDSGQCQ